MRKRQAEHTNEQLVVWIQTGENRAENMVQLWQQNRGFIATIARKYADLAEMEDLEQEGYIGLCEAVRHYEPDKDVKFISYAAFWIRQAMRRYVDNCGAVVRFPSNMVDWIRAYKRAAGQYKQAYGEWPSDVALCWLLDIGHREAPGDPAGGQDGRHGKPGRPSGDRRRRFDCDGYGFFRERPGGGCL